MKLIMLYTIGNGCSWSQDIVLPIIFESPEAVIVKFEIAVNAAYKNEKTDFIFAGHELSSKEFFFKSKLHLPEFLTIDEWFGKAMCQNFS